MSESTEVGSYQNPNTIGSDTGTQELFPELQHGQTQEGQSTPFYNFANPSAIDEMHLSDRLALMSSHIISINNQLQTQSMQINVMSNAIHEQSTLMERLFTQLNTRMDNFKSCECQRRNVEYEEKVIE